MIFVTIGTQEPFDRLVQAMDKIATKIEEEVIIQSMRTNYQVNNMKQYSFLSPKEYDQIFKRARLIISHAGMGTIITALIMNKPIIILPRIAELGEHRNEHQIATAKKLKELNYTYVADNILDLESQILSLVKRETIEPLGISLGEYASESLLKSISNFIKLEKGD